MLHFFIFFFLLSFPFSACVSCCCTLFTEGRIVRDSIAFLFCVVCFPNVISTCLFFCVPSSESSAAVVSAAAVTSKRHFEDVLAHRG